MLELKMLVQGQSRLEIRLRADRADCQVPEFRWTANRATSSTRVQRCVKLWTVILQCRSRPAPPWWNYNMNMCGEEPSIVASPSCGLLLLLLMAPASG